MNEMTRSLLHVCAASYDDAFIERLTLGLANRARVDRIRPERQVLRRMVADIHPDVLVIDLDEAGHGGTFDQGLLRDMRDVDPALSIIGASFDFSGQFVAMAFRAGANDVLDKTRVDIESANIIDRVSSARSLGRARSGRLCAVLSPSLGTDLRALSRALALQLMARSRGEDQVLLVDTTVGRPFLWRREAARNPYSIDDAIGDIARLDETLIDSAFERLGSSGVRVLERRDPMNREGGLHEYDLMPFVSLVRRFFTTTLVVARHEADGAIFRRIFRDADDVIAVTDQRLEVIGAWASFLREREADDVSIGRQHLAITRYDRRIEPGPEKIAAKLGAAMTFLFPECRVQLTNAENAGLSVLDAVRGTSFQRELVRLVDTLSGDGRKPTRQWLLRFGKVLER